MKKYRLITIFMVLITTLLNLFPIINKTQALSPAMQTISDEQQVAYNKASVVKILTTYCGRFSTTVFVQTYEFCSGATGSGFVINPDGYIATNGHVVSFSDQDKIQTAFTSKEVIKMFVDILAEVTFEEDGIRRTQTEKDTLVQQIISDKEALTNAISKMYGFYQKGLIKLQTDPVEYYVQKTENVFEFDDKNKFINPTAHYKATLIGMDYEQPTLATDGQLEFKTSDVAIIKISVDTEIPTVKLGDLSTVSQGGSILVMGFPAKADSPITSISSNTEVTITKGLVSAIKDEAGGQRKLIQTDASLGHGNSGGPAFDQYGNVIGIATYVSLVQQQGDEAADFNFLRDIDDLKKLAQKNNVVIEHGEIDNHWRSGLDLYWDSKFTKALVEFEQVKNIYPAHPLVNNYITKSEEAIANGEEVLTIQEQIYEYIPEEQFPFVVGGLVGCCLLLLIMFVVLSIFKKGKKRKQMPMRSTDIPPIPQSIPIQPTIQALGYDQPKPSMPVPPVQSYSPAPVMPSSAKPVDPSGVSLKPAQNIAQPSVSNFMDDYNDSIDEAPGDYKIVDEEPEAPVFTIPKPATPSPMKQSFDPLSAPISNTQVPARPVMPPKTSPVVPSPTASPVMTEPPKANTTTDNYKPVQTPVVPEVSQNPSKPVIPQAPVAPVNNDVNTFQESVMPQATPTPVAPPAAPTDEELPDWLRPV